MMKIRIIDQGIPNGGGEKVNLDLMIAQSSIDLYQYLHMLRKTPYPIVVLVEVYIYRGFYSFPFFSVFLS